MKIRIISPTIKEDFLPEQERDFGNKILIKTFTFQFK